MTSNKLGPTKIGFEAALSRLQRVPAENLMSDRFVVEPWILRAAAASPAPRRYKPDQLIFANTANPGLSFCNSSETTIEGMFAGYAVGSTIISPALSRYCTTHTPRLQSIDAKISLFIAHQSVRPSSAASSFRRCRFIPGDHCIRLPSGHSAVCARTLTRFLFGSLALALASRRRPIGAELGLKTLTSESLFLAH